MEEFKAGDVVVLKSGGPNMTIVGVDEMKYADCVWFDNKQNQCNSIFSVALLNHYQEPNSGFEVF